VYEDITATERNSDHWRFWPKNLGNMALHEGLWLCL